MKKYEELAEKLQYLLGRRGGILMTSNLYKVKSVPYDEVHKAVIAYRRAMDGNTNQLDDSSILVYDDGGVLQLFNSGM